MPVENPLTDELRRRLRADLPSLSNRPPGADLAKIFDDLVDAINDALGDGSLPPVTSVPGAVIVEATGDVYAQRRLRASDIDPDFAIASFGRVGDTGLLEAGDTIAASPSFTASYTSGPPVSASVTDNQGGPVVDVSGTPTAFAYTGGGPYTKTASGASVTWTLTADDGTGPQMTNEVATWGFAFYYGTGAAGLSTEGDIEGLAGSVVKTNNNHSFTVVPASEKIYVSYPTSFGTASFLIDGLFPGGFNAPSTVSVTNAHGVTTDYYLYESTQLLTGSTDVAVS